MDVTQTATRNTAHQNPGDVARRLSTWMHVVIVLVAALVCWSGARTQSQVASLPSDFPVEELEFPVEVGGFVVQSASELSTRIQGLGPANVVEIRGASDTLAERVELVAAYDSFHAWVTLANGFAFLAVSLIVFAPRVDIVPARDLFWACLLYGVAVMIGGVYTPAPSAGWTGILLPASRVVSLVVLPILMLHVGLTFPRRSSILDRKGWLFPSVVVVGALVAVWQVWMWTHWLRQGDPGSFAAITPSRAAGGVFLALVFGAGCLALVRGGRISRSDREREQVKWVLWGIAMGAVPFVFLHALPLALYGKPLLTIEVARLFSVVIPAAFSFAVIRYKFLDVDIIIRRSVLYLLLASMMVGVYALLGLVAGHRVEERWPQTEPFVPIVATLVAALLFNPTRHAFARVIDRLFFKIQCDHAQALIGFRQTLRDCSDQQELAACFADFLARTFEPRRIAVELRHGEQAYYAGEVLPSWPFVSVIPSGSNVIATLGSTGRAHVESKSFSAAWAREGYLLAHRISSEEDALGVVALGEKASERSYVAEDLDLLAHVCREVGARVHRLNLEQEVLEEVVARHRTEEMGRFRSDFFAQFAHDLRSPLTSISWSARNLLDGVVGEVSAPQREYLDGIESSARQLVRLVNNLLEITRLESAEVEIELVPTDLVGVIKESAGKLRATAQAKRVALALKIEEPAMVLGHREKLLEIVDNLLENAIRYAPPSTAIDVTLHEIDGNVEFVVEDRGPGLDPEEIDVIFEAYRQGAASPHSNQQGFGLGLFVVRSWIDRMNGSVGASNRDEGGARLVVTMPVAGDQRETAPDKDVSP